MTKKPLSNLIQRRKLYLCIVYCIKIYIFKTKTKKNIKTKALKILIVDTIIHT